MKRVSMPYKNVANRVWTTYTYDELGRVKTVTLPPNTGTTGSSGQTVYEYVLNTVKVTDPAGRWKKYTMDGFGNLSTVEEPKPSPLTGTYVTTHTYTIFNELATVTMTRDGFNGQTPTTVTQTRQFEYAGPPGHRMLWKTTFPENGVTEYGYQGKLLMSKKNRNGVWMYSYNAAQQIQEVKKYPGATALWSPNTPEDTNRRINYYYGTHPFQTNFVAQNTAGRLVAISYRVRSATSNVPTCCWQDVREFYSYTVGGRLRRKRLDVGTATMDVAFEYDNKGKLEFMVYPSGKRVKYTYDDLARHTGLKEILVNNTEDQLVNNLTYGVAGQLTSMDWKAASNMLMASQTWEYNNRLQMTKYRFNGVGWNGGVSHDYTYSATNNDGKLWRRKDNFSGEEVEYTYDSLHRLATASVLAGTVATDKLWGQQYIYDGFGNMKQKIGHAAAQWTAFNNPLNSQTNGGSGGVPGGDMDGWFYSGTNGYAPDNKRIWNIDKWHLWVGNMRVGTYSVSYDQGTQQYSVTPVKEDWYVAGRRVEPADRLGSNLAGGLRLLPYGEELQPPAVAHGRTKFATYERDAATGMDYADQRWYWPGTGRFTTEDPYEASGGPTEPNSWNRYAYVSGDPVNRNDPKGLYSCNPDPPYTCDGDAESAIWGQMGAGGMGLDWPYALLQLQEEWGSSFPRAPGSDYSGLLTSNGDVVRGWDFDMPNGSYTLFVGPAVIPVARTICQAQPTLCTMAGTAVIVIGRHLSELLKEIRGMESRSQAGQQADEEWAKEQARKICGRYPNREEQRAWHDAKRGQPRGDRDRDELLDDLLDAMDCKR